jgi:hypothetical protein
MPEVLSEGLADERAHRVKRGLTTEPPIYLQRIVA